MNDELFDDYAQDGDSATLLSALRVIARVHGVSEIANCEAHMLTSIQRPKC